MNGLAVKRPVLERMLDVPQRLIERAPVPPDVRDLLTALVRYAKQVVRSRSAGR